MTAATSPQTERLRLVLQGAVQGHGFRPTVYRLADRMKLTGWVRNNNTGLEIEIEGDTETLTEFLVQLRLAKPDAAVIRQVETIRVALGGRSGFEILPSVGNGPA